MQLHRSISKVLCETFKRYILTLIIYVHTEMYYYRDACNVHLV